MLGYSENFHLLCRKYHQHAPRERHLNGNTIMCLCQSMYIYISFIIIFRHVIIYKVTIDALHVIHCLRCFTEIFLKSKRTKIPLTTIWYIYNLCIWNIKKDMILASFSVSLDFLGGLIWWLLKILETTGIILRYRKYQTVPSSRQSEQVCLTSG